MNLKLPFVEPGLTALDDRFAALDPALDALFLEEVHAVLGQLRAARADPAAAPDGAAA